MAKTNKEVVMDRRRPNSDRRAESNEAQSAGTSERRKTQRRRQIDPTTCERDYSNDEIEFMQALDAYKRQSGRMFPTCSEILEVIRGLGYVRNDSVSEDAEALSEEAVSSSMEAMPEDFESDSEWKQTDEAEDEAAI